MIHNTLMPSIDACVKEAVAEYKFAAYRTRWMECACTGSEGMQLRKDFPDREKVGILQVYTEGVERNESGNIVHFSQTILFPYKKY